MDNQIHQTLDLAFVVTLSTLSLRSDNFYLGFHGGQAKFPLHLNCCHSPSTYFNAFDDRMGGD